MSEAKTIKQVRGQLRQLTKEILPDLMSSELFSNLEKQIEQRLKLIETKVLEAVSGMETRQKDLQNYIMREVARGVLDKAAPAESAPASNISNEQKIEEPNESKE